LIGPNGRDQRRASHRDASPTPFGTPSTTPTSPAPTPPPTPPPPLPTTSPTPTSPRPGTNPYASTFNFIPPSDFKPERRSPGGIRGATINVQSIVNQDKWGVIANIITAWGLDILALQETWLRSEEATALRATIHHASNGARAISTTAPDTDNRHLGVTLILDGWLNRHVQHIDTVDGTAIRVKLRWRRREVHIIAAYIPPAGPRNAAIALDTMAEVERWLRAAERDEIEVILLGDLNDCANPAIDRFPPVTTAAASRTPLMQYLGRSRYY
jgi:hypothetical protein